MISQGRNDVRNFITIGGSQKKFFWYLIDVGYLVKIVEKYLLKALVRAIGSIKIALLSKMAFGDAWFELFSEMFLIPFYAFFSSLVFSWKKNIVK